MTRERDQEQPSGRGPGPDAGGSADRSERDQDEELVQVEADLAQLADTESETVRAERDELRGLAQRVQADFENYRKRVMRDQVELVQRANEGLIEQLLTVLDSFGLALASLDGADETVRKGVELVYAELLGVLERAGLQRIDTDGQPFDPNVHEAVLHEEGDGEPVVTETMRTGYRLKDRVLRPAMVRVGRAPTGSGSPESLG